MQNINEFKVNNVITLRLEEEETNIYVKGQLFNQCKNVLINKRIINLGDLLEIESVDDLADHLEEPYGIIEPELIDLPPETQFWAHCSNLQTWAENDYNTNLLHSNLSFPLLKELTKLGDVKAKRVFKKEIAERFEINRCWRSKRQKVIK